MLRTKSMIRAMINFGFSYAVFFYLAVLMQLTSLGLAIYSIFK